jgi:high-affinity nickel permease
VVLASIGIALTTSVFKQHMAWFQNVGGLIGTTVSAAFLLILATINLIIFCQVWKAFRHLKRTGTYDGTTEDITVSGPLNWLFRSAFRLVGKDWHMYFVGFFLVWALIPPLKSLYWEFLLQARPVACLFGQFSCSRRCLPAVWR